MIDGNTLIYICVTSDDAIILYCNFLAVASTVHMKCTDNHLPGKAESGQTPHINLVHWIKIKSLPLKASLNSGYC